MIRFATVGNGIATERFLEAALKCGELAYTAACSPSQEAARYLSDLGELSRMENIDAVYIDGEAGLDVDQIHLLLSGGKHVLCERLSLLGREKLEALMQTAKTHQVGLTEDLPSAWEPGFLSIQKALPRLGSLLGASFQYCRYSPEDQHTVPAASAFLDAGIHCIAPLVRLFGMPDRLTADPVVINGSQDGAGAITASYQDMKAELLYSQVSGCRISNRILGTDGALIFQNLSAPSHIVFYSAEGGKEIISSHPTHSGISAQLHGWVNQILQITDWREQMEYTLMAAEAIEKVDEQLEGRLSADKWA